MTTFHNTTPEQYIKLYSLPVKKEIVTANGIKFRDISKLCNCQVHDMWLMQRIEYLTACKKWGNKVLDSFYVTGEPVPVE